MTHAVKAFQNSHEGVTPLHAGSILRPATSHTLTPEFRRELSNALIKHDGAMLFFSIDQFHELTASFGADASDQIVNRVLEAIRNRIRSSDASCRYHNNIVVMLSNTSVKSAHQVADRMRETMANLTFWLGREQHKITVSIGYTGVNKEDNRDSILARADLWLSDQLGHHHIENKTATDGNRLMHLCIA